MRELPLPTDTVDLTTHKSVAPALPAALQRFVDALKCAPCGRLTVETPTGRRWVYQGNEPGPDATVMLKRWRALRRLMGGDIAFAEAYREGDWSSPDLVAFFTWVTANEQALTALWRGTSMVRLLDRLRHGLRGNSRAGSRRNIAAHYDLGNDFYAGWLDAGMNYSSALYETGEETLETAQAAKIARALNLLGLEREGRVLEIGSGWGAVIESVARAGHHVTGITLSREQLRYASERVSSAGLGDHADLQLIDYRDVGGHYDAIVSIEMLEAVGEQYWQVYFERLAELLKPGGRAVLQVITITEDRFEAYRRRPDFIQRYIFPGGMLPTRSIIAARADDAGLRPVASEHFGASYALTLAVWRQRFLAAQVDNWCFGGDEKFRRLWEYYLAYCEAGFRVQALDVGFYVFERPVAEASLPTRNALRSAKSGSASNPGVTMERK